MNEETTIKNFLAWMNKNKIDACIPFFAIQEGRDGKIPVWTNGKVLFNADELYDKYRKSKSIDISETKRQWREDRNQRKNESLK